MIAVVDVEGQTLPCVIKWTGQRGLLSVKADTYCGQTTNAADGVRQIGEFAPVCERCASALRESKQR